MNLGFLDEIRIALVSPDPSRVGTEPPMEEMEQA
jgi:hypothetical protein